MKFKHNYSLMERLLSPYVLLLMAVGLILNVGLSQLVIWLGLPLYIDNVGSILTAALGGPLPGMTVGFLSNLINSASDPITLYYGILTVIIALISAILSERGALKKIRGCLFAVLLFIIIGGAAGSCLTWLLYGGGIGGIAGPLATVFHNGGMNSFWAQFSADMVVDVFDKLITVALVYIILHFGPKKLLSKFPLGYIYTDDTAETERKRNEQLTHYKRISLNTRVVRLMTVSLIVLSVLATTVAVYHYQQKELSNYSENVISAANISAALIDGDKVPEFLAKGRDAKGYAETEQTLKKVFGNAPGLEYLYVYQIKEDGNHVVFDLDTPKFEGDEPGSVVAFDNDFSQYKDILMSGGTVPPVMSNGEYGRLITALSPVKNSAGITVAYACADVSTSPYIEGIFLYIIKLIALEFGISVIIIVISIWYAQRKIVSPVNSLVKQSLAFDSTDPELWLDSPGWLERRKIDTGDEIETLYDAVCGTEERVAKNVAQMRRSAEIERRNLELTKAVAKADATNAAKSDFYSRMSHDMRTPMNGILGLAELSRDESDPAVLRSSMKKIEDAGAYLLGLINDTLDISKLEQRKLSLNPAPVAVGEILDSIGNMIAPSIKEKGLDFTLTSKDVQTDIFIIVDSLRLKQIFMNLLSNAVKFTPPGGRVCLSIEKTGGDEDTADCRIVIVDTGRGMSESFVKGELFKPFTQENVTQQYSGTGLGLAIVKNLVELMNGTISVKSKLDSGTTFTVCLSFKLAHPGSCGGFASAEASCDTNVFFGKRVLIAEDNDLNAEIASRILAKYGILTERARDGREALDMFALSSEGYFDAILMDVRMPVLDGITATRLIRRKDRGDASSIPIIAMTANAYPEDVEQTKAAGMNAHLSKPIDTGLLIKTLAQLISPDK